MAMNKIPSLYRENMKEKGNVFHYYQILNVKSKKNKVHKEKCFIDCRYETNLQIIMEEFKNDVNYLN